MCVCVLVRESVKDATDKLGEIYEAVCCCWGGWSHDSGSSNNDNE